MFSGITSYRKYLPPPPQTPPVAVKPWGCHSKPRKDGYWARSVRRDTEDEFVGGYPKDSWVWIKDTGTKECQYRKSTPDDPRCKGCTSP